jgi:hypothetical protein
MAKTKAVVLTALPQPGQEAVTPALNVEGFAEVVLAIPMLQLKPGKSIHVSLQSEKDNAWYGVPGVGWRAGQGAEIRETIKVPAGAKALRVLLFTDLEAASRPIEGDVKLSQA